MVFWTRGGWRESETSIQFPEERVLRPVVRPDAAVECSQRHSAPLQIEAALLITVNLNMHDHGTGLLDLADATQFNRVAESGADLSAGSVSPQVAAGGAWQEKENRGCTEQNAEHQHRRCHSQGGRHVPVGRPRARLSRMDARLGGDVAHLHQDEADYRHQHEDREGQQESAVHGEQCGGQHHEKRNDREKVEIAIALRRKQAHYHYEQNQMDRCVEKTTRDQEIIGQVERHIAEGKKRSPALGNEPGATMEPQVSAEKQGRTDQDDRYNA